MVNSNLKAKIVPYHLYGKVTMWWDPLKKSKHVNENMFTWNQFKRHFQNEYISNHYYDKKMQYFFELKLGSMTMGKYENKFLGFLKYVGFIKYGKVKIHIFLSGLPSFCKENIQYDEPRNLT
jgi:hypothetical protein